MCILLITNLSQLLGRLGAHVIIRFNYTTGVVVVTPTDRPKSVHNRCVIEVFGCVFVLSLCFLDLSLGVRAFVMGLSQIPSFSLLPSCIHHFKWDSINNIDHMCIKGTEPSSVILSKISLKMLKDMPQKYKNKLKPKRMMQ